MSDTTTKRLIEAYFQERRPQMFFTGFFRTPEINFTNAEEIEVDIMRSDEDISVAVQDLSTGYRANSADVYTNKGFVPPVHKESIPLNSHDLVKRMPGQNPFENPNYRANVMAKMMQGMNKVENKIRRAIEFQASQVLQTGKAVLTDMNGNPVYSIDYKPKASHFPTVGTPWDDGAATIAEDINSLAEEVRNDGLDDPDQLIMGAEAFEAFIKNDDIQKRYDNRRIDMGTISPYEVRGQGGQYRGIVEIGNYRFDIWTYAGRFKDPQNAAKVQYMDPKKVIVRASAGRLDGTYGAIPNIGRELGLSRNVIPEMPGRFSSAENGVDLSTNIWLSEDGEQLFGGVGTRPLMIPTAIDTFGCATVLA